MVSGAAIASASPRLRRGHTEPVATEVAAAAAAPLKTHRTAHRPVGETRDRGPCPEPRPSMHHRHGRAAARGHTPHAALTSQPISRLNVESTCSAFDLRRRGRARGRRASVTITLSGMPLLKV